MYTAGSIELSMITEYFSEVKFRMLMHSTIIMYCTADISLHVRPEYLPHLSSVIVLNHDLRLLDSIGRGETVCVHHDQ